MLLYAEQQNPNKKVEPHYLTTKDGTIQYFQLGKGEPIILISGYSTDVACWNRKFLQTLASQHRIVIFNNRNMGGSYSQRTHYNSHDLAADVDQLIHALELKRPTVLGHSMGGMVAQQLAVSYPEDVGRLILVSTMMPGSQAILPNAQVQDAMKNMPTSKIGRYILALRLFFPPSARMEMSIAMPKEYFSPDGYFPENPTISLLHQQAEVLQQWSKDSQTAIKIPAIQVPTLIIVGSADQVIPPINSELLAKKIRHTKLVSWPNGGHALFFQYPVEIATKVNQFLTK